MALLVRILGENITESDNALTKQMINLFYYIWYITKQMICGSFKGPYVNVCENNFAECRQILLFRWTPREGPVERVKGEGKGSVVAGRLRLQDK